MTENTIDLAEQFSQICRLLHMLHHQQHKQHGPMGDPHRGQGRVLSLLKMQPEISQKELSYLLDIRQQSLGELLMKLEKGGYITRTPSENDNRAVDVRLTEAGLTAASEMRGDSAAELFAVLTEEEQKILSGYLGRIVEGMEENLEPGNIRGCCGGGGGRHGHHGPHAAHEELGHHGRRCGKQGRMGGMGKGRCGGGRHGHEEEDA